MKTAIVIPARLASKRFPEKMLQSINGLPMIVHVAKMAEKSNIGECLIACCSEKLANIVAVYGCNAVVTEEAVCGTERVWLAVKKMPQKPEIIINLQGDMVMFNPAILQQIADSLIQNNADIATPVRKIKRTEYTNDVCTVFDNMESEICGRAIYFSRQPIPNGSDFLYKHIGIYAYTYKALQNFAEYKQTFLEQVEKLEQLRAIVNKMKIIAVPINGETYSINTEEEYIKFVQYMK